MPPLTDTLLDHGGIRVALMLHRDDRHGAGDLTSRCSRSGSRVTGLLTKTPQRQLIRIVSTRTTSRHARHLPTVDEDTGRSPPRLTTALYNERHPLGQ